MFVSKGTIGDKTILDNGVAPNMQQAIIWTDYGLGRWRAYASLHCNVLKYSIPFCLKCWCHLPVYTFLM